MFKLQPAPTFRAKVKIPVPGSASVPVEIEFRHKTKSALQAYLERAKTEENDLASLEEIIVSWSGFEAEYSRELLALLIDAFPGAAVAIAAAYTRELTDARLGN